MYVPKIKNPHNLGERLTRLSKAPPAGSAAIELVAPPSIAGQSLDLAASALPSGVLLTGILDSFVFTSAINTIGQIVDQRPTLNAVDANLMAPPPVYDRVDLDQKALENLVNSTSSVLPISSLAELSVNAVLTQEYSAPSTLKGAALAINPAFIDLSLLPAGAPVLITRLSSPSNPVITVIDKVEGNVDIANFRLPQAVSETFINTGLDALTATSPATALSTLSLTAKVEFMGDGIDVTTGITVSGTADSSVVILYIPGGASGEIGSADVINLGEGNNVVFDGDGSILNNLVDDSHSVSLGGTGVNSAVHFASQLEVVSEFIAIAPNGRDSSQALNAVQSEANQVHSLAWPQFEGSSYVLETIKGAEGAHAMDILVELVGAITFTGASGELTQGMLH